MKIAMLFPYAPAYREAIYQLMDKEFDIDWYFCRDAVRPLKMLDYHLLKNCSLDMKEIRLWGGISFYRGIRRIHFEQYDVIIIAGVFRNLSEWRLALEFGRLKKKPKILFWTHGMYGKEGCITRWVKNLFYKSAEGLLLYGNYAKQLMVEGMHYNPERLFVIHNSLDYHRQLELRNKGLVSPTYFDYFHNKYPVILFIGRLTRVKKLHMILDAVRDLKQKNEFYNVVFVGDGEERMLLEERARDNNIESQVWFYGASYDEETNARLIYNADICVAPGNIGLSAMHVLMFGCPAITHNDFKWQMPEFEAIHPYETGLFFKKDDVGSLAECVSEWFKVNQSRRDLVREACYKEIDNGWTPYYQIQILHQVVNGLK